MFDGGEKDFRPKHGEQRHTRLPLGSADSTEPVIDPPNELFDQPATRTGRSRVP
jgi:hypothetical protein